jgi:protein associated with RNAse G/E
MITVIKLGPQGEEKIRYTGETVERTDDSIVISASWTMAVKDLGYARFEPGDHFTEYYYRDHWFNIFEIASAADVLKGWYCNVTEPAQIYDDRIEQVDLFLDVWVQPTGETLVLDEDEFEVAMTLMSKEQRVGAQKGLQNLLQWVQERYRPFDSIR